MRLLFSVAFGFTNIFKAASRSFGSDKSCLKWLERIA